MSRYLVRVQLVSWYEIVVNASSPEDAPIRAEALRSTQIKARGKLLHEETGLADPEFHQPLHESAEDHDAGEELESDEMQVSVAPVGGNTLIPKKGA